jgi:ATP-dependent DNA helicase RecG
MKQMQNFSAPMLSRNPALHFVFARMGMAEEQGLGLDSLKERAQALGLPLPTYSWDAPYLVLTLYRSKKAAAKTLRADVLASLSKSEKRGWEWIATRDAATTAEYQEAMNLPNRTAKNHMKKFKDLGLLAMVGSGRAARYEVAKK